MAKALRWEGKRVTARMREAQVAGVNQTMGACVIHAKRNHPWQNQTATLEGSINIVDYARPGLVSQPVRGLWGSQDVRYALIHELGGTIRPVNADALYIQKQGEIVAVVQEVEIKARPYLRPAADVEYPRLSQRIRTAFDRVSI